VMTPRDGGDGSVYVDVTAAMAEQPRSRTFRLTPATSEPDPFGQVEV